MTYDEKKFENFNGAVQHLKAQGANAMMIHHPEVIGDTFEEIVENLNRLANAHLFLGILSEDDRAKPPDPT